MLILPAIDMLSGKCVRLTRGAFDDATIYGDPLEQFAALEAGGATWVHIVDLDGAREGKPMQHAVLRRLAKSSQVKIQCGGGVRQWAHVQSLLDAGVARVVVGSVAVKRPKEVREWIGSFGLERICCAFDARPARDGFKVMVKGWTESADAGLKDALHLYSPGACKHVLVTDVSRDGVMGGPNVALMRELAASRGDLEIQASGGVASLDDLVALRATGVAAAIVGRALYERKFTLEEALAL
ncbi:MAG: 1-(5-phosphoribosyl)-5-[(5-phosphoribosylamino)methylideneamino]imidazole-4-carboxamide isomerase [Caulobacteraceae bacterium]